MRGTDLQLPLSRVEHDDLGKFLDSAASAMPLPQADGFLTGIASAPRMLMPSEWQPRLLGEPTFESVQEAERVLVLVMRLYNQILTDLNEGRATRPAPSLSDDELSQWCKGYLEASRMDPAWAHDETGIMGLFPFGVLAGEFDLVGEESADGTIIEDPSEHLQMYRDSLPERVLDLNDYWVASRRGEARQDSPSTRQKVGRNEKCPCGSGRKYKKCCGA